MIGQVSEATSLRYGIVLVAFMGLMIAGFANKVENWRLTEASTKVPEEIAEA